MTTSDDWPFDWSRPAQSGAAPDDPAGIPHDVYELMAEPVRAADPDPEEVG